MSAHGDYKIDSLEEWLCYRVIIKQFCKVFGMSVSIRKSSFYNHKLEKDNLESVTSILPFKTFELESGFKYLGYFLKPNDYRF